jgi:hypothetical protein
MKRLKKTQLGPWCDFCDKKTNRAVLVGRGFNGFSCETHRDELKEAEEKDDGHMSEGDYQSWGNL